MLAICIISLFFSKNKIRHGELLRFCR